MADEKCVVCGGAAMAMVDVGPICSTHSYMLGKDRRKDLDDLIEYRKLDREVYLVDVKDCAHPGCHSPMGSGQCPRAYIVFLQRKVKEAQKWAKRYKWLADHPKKKG